MENVPVNLLTDEECEIVKKLSENPRLNLKDCSHSFKYYGIDREPNKVHVKTLEDILIKWCPDLVSFSNFTGQIPNKIRCQVRYSPSFIGVHYLDIPTNRKPEEV